MVRTFLADSVFQDLFLRQDPTFPQCSLIKMVSLCFVLMKFDLLHPLSTSVNRDLLRRQLEGTFTGMKGRAFRLISGLKMRWKVQRCRFSSSDTKVEIWKQSHLQTECAEVWVEEPKIPRESLECCQQPLLR